MLEQWPPHDLFCVTLEGKSWGHQLPSPTRRSPTGWQPYMAAILWLFAPPSMAAILWWRPLTVLNIPTIPTDSTRLESPGAGCRLNWPFPPILFAFPHPLRVLQEGPLLLWGSISWSGRWKQESFIPPVENFLWLDPLTPDLHTRESNHIICNCLFDTESCLFDTKAPNKQLSFSSIKKK